MEKSIQIVSGQENRLAEGIYAAALTPLDADLTCDCNALIKHCQNLMARGCQGVALFGTTGEGPSFSVEEKISALETMVSEGLDPKKLIIGNGSASIPDSVRLAQAVLKQKCASFLMAPPSFYKNINEEGVIAFYREVIERVAHPGLRVILYHIPQFSGVPMTVKVIETLIKEFPRNVIGMKESEGNLSFTKKVISSFPGFQVFVGDERQIIEATFHGASGSICGIANLVPELIVSLFMQGKRAICENPKELDVVFEAIKGIPFIAAAKAFMEETAGESWGFLRPPLIPLDAAQKNHFFQNFFNRTPVI